MTRFKVFYHCASTGDRVDGSAPSELDRDSAVDTALRVLRDHADFFGIVDADDRCIQFYVEADGRIWMEVPDPERRGSMGKHITLVELGPALLAVRLPIDPSDYEGLDWRPW